MEREIQEFIARAIKSLQRQIDNLEKTIGKLEKRISLLEPQEPDEMIVQNARGILELYLIRDEEGNYIKWKEDPDDGSID